MTAALALLAAELEPVELALADHPLAEVLRRLASQDQPTVRPPPPK